MNSLSKGPGIFQLLFTLLLFAGGAWLLARKLRPVFRRWQGRHWPIASATIKKAGIGFTTVAKGLAKIPVGFFGYSFEIDGVQYASLFAISGPGTEAAHELLQEEMAGHAIRVRYKPSDPNVSFILDVYDSLFAGYTMSQDPNLLDCAPNVDLRSPAS